MLFGTHNAPEDADTEPRWPAIVVVVASVALAGALPQSVAVGPFWFPLATVVIFLAGAIITHRRHSPHWNTVWGIMLITAITLFLVGALIELITVVIIGDKTVSPRHLLFSGACLWLMNVLVFSLWYWRLDAGG